MKRRRRPPLVRLAVALHGLAGVKRLDLDPPFLQLLEHGRVEAKLAVGAAAHDQTLGKLVLHLLEVLHYERMSFPAPPVGYDAVGQDDQIASVLLAVDDDPPEAVVREPDHRLHGTAPPLTGARSPGSRL